jgi:hypothetical protein
MSQQHLATYLNDHLAGSVTALEILGRLGSAHAGTALEGFLTPLRAEIEADQAELKAIMERLGIKQSALRKAAAWLAEKLAGVKVLADDTEGGSLRLLELLEVLSLGIEGKRSLWRSLEAASAGQVRLRGPDYQGLTRRAEAQRGRVEEFRVEAARKALSW